MQLDYRGLKEIKGIWRVLEMSDALHVNDDNVHSPYFIPHTLLLKHLEQGLIYPSN